MDYVVTRSDDYLAHYGISGQKHGIRRYQNEDGSLTPEGKERYGEQRGWEARQMYKRGTITKQEYKDRRKASDRFGAAGDTYFTGNTRGTREFQRRHEKGLKVASAVMSGLAGATYGALSGSTKSKGAAVVGGLLGGAAGAAGGYGLGALSNYGNRKILDVVYNGKKPHG